MHARTFHKAHTDFLWSVREAAIIKGWCDTIHSWTRAMSAAPQQPQALLAKRWAPRESSKSDPFWTPRCAYTLMGRVFRAKPLFEYSRDHNFHGFCMARRLKAYWVCSLSAVNWLKNLRKGKRISELSQGNFFARRSSTAFVRLLAWISISILLNSFCPAPACLPEPEKELSSREKLHAYACKLSLLLLPVFAVANGPPRLKSP